MSGTTTFLFTDIEGSTTLVQALGEAYVRVLQRHRELIGRAVRANGGRVFGDEGDALFAAFPRAAPAVAAAIEAQTQLAREPWPEGTVVRVRMGLHSGDATELDGNYFGVEVHRAARIASAGHGGQILISAATGALVADMLPGGTELRDLGTHRLKDLQRPERIHQVQAPGLPRQFPTLKTLEAAPNNLPQQLTTFVGREPVVARVRELLEATRVLTLTGPGGTGKTRLSLQVAGELVESFRDGVYFVALAAISDAGLVPSAIAEALGLHETPARSPLDRVIDHLRDRTVLLALDNMEQVLDAAGPIAEIVAACPKVRVLSTSRAPLRIYGEQEFPVPPLGVPAADDADGAGRGTLDPDVLMQSEAVRLFVDRASAIRPDFRLTAENAGAVAELSRQLDGLPLAIELAAARIKLLTPEAMLTRLERRLDLLAGGARDLPARQRTLRGAIMWSHELLDPPQRRLFARASVFRAGAALDQAEAVLGPADEIGIEVFDGLAALVDHSLMRQVASVGEPRFAMLESIREFAAEQLEASGEAEAMRRRHAESYLALVRTVAPGLTGADPGPMLDRIETEMGNIRAALDWAQTASDAAIAIGIGSSLWRFWQRRGHLREGLQRMDQALALGDAAMDPELLAAGLDAAAGLAYWQADLIRANELYERALSLRRQLGDLRGIAEELYNLAVTNTVGNMGDIELAVRSANESLSIFRELGDKGGEARALWALGQADGFTGRAAEAEQALEESVRLFREVDDRFMLAWVAYTLGVQHYRSGRLDEARRCWTEALRAFVAGGDVTGYELVIDTLSWLAYADGDRKLAMRLAGFIDALQERTGSGLSAVTRRLDAGFDTRDLMSDPEMARVYEDGQAMRVEDAIVAALGEPARAS